MKSLRSVACAVALLVTTSMSAAEEGSAQSVPDKELQAMLDEYARATEQFYNGHPEAVKALWSHSDDVTLSGAAGGATAKGWRDVSARLDWASAEFKGTNGTRAVEPIQIAVSGDVAYIVRYEHIRYHRPDQQNPAQRDYRATVIFRRGAEGWRVVHRHADTLMARQEIR